MLGLPASTIRAHARAWELDSSGRTSTAAPASDVLCVVSNAQQAYFGVRSRGRILSCRTD